MKTKDFVKLLQEEDPSGELHVRFRNGGFPFSIQCLDGYWDGPYEYIDENGDFVTSTEGSKIDIYSMEIDDFIERLFDFHDPDNWEKIKSKFKFNFGYTDAAYCKIREDKILNEAKLCWDDLYDFHKKSFEEQKVFALEMEAKGWTWFQNKLVDDASLKPNFHHYYTWKIFDENGKEQSSNVYNTEVVYKSGIFERLDNEKMPGYYQWVKINKDLKKINRILVPKKRDNHVFKDAMELW